MSAPVSARGGSGSIPNGTTATRRSSAGSAEYSIEADPAEAAENAEPEISLAVAGAEKRASRRESQDLLEHRRPGERAGVRGRTLVTVVVRQRLEEQRVVEVVDDAGASAREALHSRDRQLLRDDGVAGVHEAAEAPVAELLRLDDAHAGQVVLRIVRDHERHVEATSEFRRELPVANARAGHRAAHRLVRHEKDAGHGLRG